MAKEKKKEQQGQARFVYVRVCDRNEKRIAENGKVRAHCLSVSKVVKKKKNALHDKSF